MDEAIEQGDVKCNIESGIAVIEFSHHYQKDVDVSYDIHSSN